MNIKLRYKEAAIGALMGGMIPPLKIFFSNSIDWLPRILLGIEEIVYFILVGPGFLLWSISGIKNMVVLFVFNSLFWGSIGLLSGYIYEKYNNKQTLRRWLVAILPIIISAGLMAFNTLRYLND